MMRTLFVVSGSPDSASPRYRAGHIAESLRLAMGSGVEVRVVSVDAPNSVPIHPGEVIVLHRVGFAGAGERFLQVARRVGAIVVWSTDDLIFTPDFAHQIGLHFPDDSIRYAQHREAAKDFARMLRACDAVLVSTDYLAQRVECALAVHAESSGTVGTLLPPVCVLRNALSSEQLALAETAVRDAAPLPTSPDRQVPETSVTLAYLSGSATHNLDLGMIAAPLASVLARFPQTRLLIVGPVTLPSALQPFADAGRVLRHAFAPWRDLFGLLTHCRVDINLAPLDTARPFSHAKSEVKFLEAAAVGIPTVASLSAGFSEGVQDGDDCLLAASSADWDYLLTDLIQNPDRRRILGNAALAVLHTRGTTAANAQTVQSVFERLARLAPENAEARDTVGWVRPSLRERSLRAAKIGEQKLMRLVLRLSRHLHRLHEDVGGG